MDKDLNVLFVTLDGMRVDYLNHCPFLSELINNNMSFTNMITSAPYTFSSMYSIFSGLYPSKNGVNAYYNMFKFKQNKCKTFTQYLKDNGYYAFSQILNDCVIPNQGFDEIKIHKSFDDQLSVHKNLIKGAIEKGKFFGYLQYTKIHEQTVKNSKKYGDFDEEYFGEKGQERNKNIFTTLAKGCDNYVKELIGFLKENSILENTLLIFHADHGTSNGEKKGEKLYGVYVYDYTIKTFCTFINPKIIKGKKNIQCRTIDIMPTLLKILNIPEQEGFIPLQGKHLFSIIDGCEEEERIAFSETGGLSGPWPSRKEHNVFGIRLNNKKIIYNKTPKTWEFYNLSNDPQEETNLIDENLKEIEMYKKILLKKFEENEISI